MLELERFLTISKTCELRVMLGLEMVLSIHKNLSRGVRIRKGLW